MVLWFSLQYLLHRDNLEHSGGELIGMEYWCICIFWCNLLLGCGNHLRKFYTSSVLNYLLDKWMWYDQGSSKRFISHFKIICQTVESQDVHPVATSTLSRHQTNHLNKSKRTSFIYLPLHCRDTPSWRINISGLGREQELHNSASSAHYMTTSRMHLPTRCTFSLYVLLCHESGFRMTYQILQKILNN